MIFGNLKSQARGYLNSPISDQIMSSYNATECKFIGDIPPIAPLSKLEAQVVLEKAWNRLKPEQILSIWLNAIVDKLEDIANTEKEKEEFRSNLILTFGSAFHEMRGKITQFNEQQIKNILLLEKQHLIDFNLSRRNARRNAIQRKRANNQQQALLTQTNQFHYALPVIRQPIYQQQNNLGQIIQYQNNPIQFPVQSIGWQN